MSVPSVICGMLGSSVGSVWTDKTRMFELLPQRRLLSFTPLVADFNGDGRVDESDFTVLAQHFNGTGDHAAGDANSDGSINSVDFNLLVSQFGSSGPGKLIFSDEFIAH